MDKTTLGNISRLEQWGVNTIEQYIDSDKTLFTKNTPKQATKKGIWLSFGVGFVITLMIAAVDILYFQTLSFFDYSLKQWLFIVLFNIVLVGIEFWLLFHIGFQIVAKYIAFLSNTYIDRTSIKASLVRAILEVDEPVSERFGRELFKRRKKHYWLRLALYKLKVVISNVIAKIIIRKLLGRVGLRSFAPLISVLVVGSWDAWIQQSVLKEVRFRIASRLFVIEQLSALKKRSLSETFLESLIRFIAIRILMLEKHDVNLTFMILEIEKHFEINENKYSDIYDRASFEKVIFKLSDTEKKYFSQLVCGLFSFKHKHWSIDEKQLIRFLNIQPEQIKEQQTCFDQLCLNQE